MVVEELNQLLMKGTSGSGTLQFYNAGGSTATIVGIVSGLHIFDKLPMVSPYQTAHSDKSLSIKLRAGVYGTKSFSVEPDASFTLYRQTRERRTGVYVMGSVIYRDDIGIQRETRFCRKYDWDAERFLPVNDVDYENSD